LQGLGARYLEAWMLEARVLVAFHTPPVQAAWMMSGRTR
jgi:hypothetical protein